MKHGFQTSTQASTAHCTEEKYDGADCYIPKVDVKKGLASKVPKVKL